MGSPDDEKNILELLCQKKRSTQYIHVFPGELKVYSLLDAGIRDKKGKRCLLEVRMMEFTRESLARFSAKGTPIPVRFVELPINGQEEEVKAFLQMLRKTGILLDIGGAIYGVSRTAMMKMHKQMEMYGAYDYTPIHDLMLAEKLLAAEPSGHRPTEKRALKEWIKKTQRAIHLPSVLSRFQAAVLWMGSSRECTAAGMREQTGTGWIYCARNSLKGRSSGAKRSRSVTRITQRNI